MADLVVYLSLFVALFFEVFALLTFFEKEAIFRRKVTPRQKYPSVSIIVPCFNEERTIAATVESLLNLQYPKNKLSLILVNDGSTDNTKEVMLSYQDHPQIQIINKSNGGKHTGLNAGIMASKSNFIGCLDADSFVDPEALQNLMPHFDDPKIGAVTASMSVHSPTRLLERMQQAEYLIGISLRHILSSLNALYVTPGPFTIFRREVFTKLGTFKPAHNTEDMEIALRMQRAGYRIENAPLARVFTKVPTSIPSLIKQRVRWTTGFLRNGFDYRDLFGNPRYGVLGLLILPLGVASILSAVALFALTVTEAVKWTAAYVEKTLSVPIRFAFQFPNFDPFFLPGEAVMFLAFFSLAMMIAFIGMGAYISKTKTTIWSGILWYVLLYSIVAPLWLARSVLDILFGVRRSWR